MFRLALGLPLRVSHTKVYMQLCTIVWCTIWHTAVLHCGAKKLHPFYVLNNFVKSRSILTVFGKQIPERICNKMVTKLYTSPNKWQYITVWIIACVKLFITTVIQALNVMTNWQLQTHNNKCSTCLPLALTCALRRSPNDQLLDQWCYVWRS